MKANTQGHARASDIPMYRGFEGTHHPHDSYGSVLSTQDRQGAWALPRHAGLAEDQTCNHYTIVLASGCEDGGKRATLALSMACTAQSLDLDTLVFMVGEGSYWAYQGHADPVEIEGFPSLASLLESFVELGGRLAVCSTCNKGLCHADGSKPAGLVRRADVEVQGMAAVMEHLLKGRAVSF